MSFLTIQSIFWPPLHANPTVVQHNNIQNANLIQATKGKKPLLKDYHGLSNVCETDFKNSSGRSQLSFLTIQSIFWPPLHANPTVVQHNNIQNANLIQATKGKKPLLKDYHGLSNVCETDFKNSSGRSQLSFLTIQSIFWPPLHANPTVVQHNNIQNLNLIQATKGKNPYLKISTGYQMSVKLRYSMFDNKA